MNPLMIIDKLNDILKSLLKEEKISNYDDLLKYYSADYCMILLKFYPSATVMINNNYLSCALLINGKLYNSSGIIDINDYHMANNEELNYIRLSFNELSEVMYDKLFNSIKGMEFEKKTSYVLRKNSNNLT